MLSERISKIFHVNHRLTHLLYILMMIFCSSFKNSYGVDKNHQKHMEDFLNQSGIADAVSRLVIYIIDITTKSNPELTPKQIDNLGLFVNKHLNYEKIKPDLIAFYTEYFKNDEQVINSTVFTQEINRKFLLSGDDLEKELIRLGNIWLGDIPMIHKHPKGEITEP